MGFCLLETPDPSTQCDPDSDRPDSLLDEKYGADNTLIENDAPILNEAVNTLIENDAPILKQREQIDPDFNHGSILVFIGS
ncbi:hypothetical protein MAR_026362 [Mya arenaria]|uniref:Uncharacterized protein n=1 Tax=Mya arenaria TaxID=6604 RepID=A0ABY7ESQ2_MYAAR|nr:hypothetical protein MAR_026362 [Mya arenaria]